MAGMPQLVLKFLPKTNPFVGFFLFLSLIVNFLCNVPFFLSTSVSLLLYDTTVFFVLLVIDMWMCQIVLIFAMKAQFR